MIYVSKYSHQDEQLDNILHVCDEHWHGIRNAAGYCPGHKFLISHKNRQSPDTVQEIKNLIDEYSIDHIFFHGLSPAAELIARGLKTSCANSTIDFVGHVNSTQFVHEFEVDMLNRAIDLKTEKVFRRLYSVKPHFDLVSTEFEAEPLFNFAPQISAPNRKTNQLLQHSVFIPLTHGDWRKNVDTNFYAAKHLNLEIVTIKPPTFQVGKQNSKVTTVGFLDPERLFNLYSATKFTLAITMSECQPMTQLEALSNNSAVFTGPLNLPDSNTGYESIFEIASPDNLKEITDKILAWMEEDSTEKTQQRYLEIRNKWARESYLAAIT